MFFILDLSSTTIMMSDLSGSPVFRRCRIDSSSEASSSVPTTPEKDDGIDWGKYSLEVFAFEEERLVELEAALVGTSTGFQWDHKTARPRILEPDGWLNDDDIASYVDAIMEDPVLSARHQRKEIFIVKPLLLTTLLEKYDVWKTSTHPAGVIFGSRQEARLSEYKTIYFIANIMNQHWILIRVEMDGFRVTTFDSLINESYMSVRNDIIQKIMELFDQEAATTLQPSSNSPRWSQVDFQGARQQNSSDCGVFTLAWLTEMVHDVEAN
jgi:hypothetical protein